MTEIEKIKRYIERTRLNEDDGYYLGHLLSMIPAAFAMYRGIFSCQRAGLCLYPFRRLDRQNRPVQSGIFAVDLPLSISPPLPFAVPR